jgi:DNA-binding SARP family transcriptional activator
MNGRGDSGVGAESVEIRDLRMMDGFELRGPGMRARKLPLGAQRLVAFAALNERGVHRGAAAESLWPDGRDGRAAANLRSALWHLRRVGHAAALEIAGPRLRLAAGVRVDLWDLRRLARRLVASAGEGCVDYEASIERLSRELLPDWPDAWLAMERQRWNQLRLHALEALARELAATESYVAALEAALAAVAIEPVRESSHRAVIAIHIAEGNAPSALQHYQRYRDLLWLELGVVPSPQIDQLVRPLADAWRRPSASA